MSQVAISKQEYRAVDIGSLVEPIGGMARYVSKGDRVCLKVNLLQASDPSTAVTTHPDVISAVAKSVIDAGGEPFIGDSPAGRFSKKGLKDAYDFTGMTAIADDLGIELNYDTGWTKVDVKGGKRIRRLKVCDFALGADRIIALPKLKTHVYQVMTLATKIMYGIVPGAEKARYHAVYPRKQAFADMLLDVLSVTPPDLFILDGIMGMVGNGPMGGDPVDTGVLMASTDAVAMDIAVCRMLNIEPVGVPTLKRAKFRDLWPDSIDYPVLTPEDVMVMGFKLPSGAGHIATGKRTPKRSPVITERCTACGRCEEICPKDAITIPEDRAVIEYEKCIRCFCCHEVCPDKAIALKALGKRGARF